MKAILRSINNFSCKLKQSNNLKYNISPKIRSNKFKNISGNGNVVIEDALNKNAKDYKIYGNTVQKILPDGYTQVDYIESGGNQYINTGVNADSNLSIKMNFSSSYHIQQRHMGAIKNDNGVYIRYHITLNGSGASSYLLSYSGQTNSAQNLLSTIDDNKHYLNLDIYNKKISVDEETPIDLTLQPFDTGLNYWLFARNSNNSTNMSFAIMRIYDCKMFYNDVLVRNFIPCYRNSDNEVGMYDLVNDVFYTNQGTGTFTYGSIAPTPDAPIEMVSCGDRTKNLIPTNSNDYEIGTINSSTGINQDNTTRIRTKDYYPITVGNYNISIENSNYSYVNILYYDKDKNFLYAQGAIQNITNRNISITNENVVYFRSIFRLISNDDIVPSEILAIKPMITLGDIKLSFEPYGYKIPINVRSDNLFDGEYELGYYNTATGEKASSTAQYRNKNFIKVNPNTSYTFSINNSKITGTLRYLYYDINKNLLNSEVTGGDFTTPLNCYYLNWYSTVLKTNYPDGLINPMIVEGSTVPSKYIPYYNETTNIYLDEPLRKIDGYSDYIDFINGKVVRKIYEYKITGNENFTNNYETNLFDVQSLFNDNPFITNYGLCNMYRYSSIQSGINNNTINGEFVLQKVSYVETGLKKYNLFIKNTFYNDSNVFKTYLKNLYNNGTPVVINYPLETPTEEDIELPNINLIEGKNIITIGTELESIIEIEYYSKEIIDISNYKYNLRKVED
ncbi:MAG: hypothetical protein ACI4VE_05550 [Clostridia bacterium]